MYSARATLDNIAVSRIRLFPAVLVLERDDCWATGVGLVLTRWAGCNTPLDFLRITLSLARDRGILGQSDYEVARRELQAFMQAALAAKRNSEK